MKIMAAGMAIRKLKEMARARSIRPTFFTWLEKKATISKSDTPCKPGKMIFLLLASRKRKGGVLYSFRSSLIIARYFGLVILSLMARCFLSASVQALAYASCSLKVAAKLE